MGWPVSPSTFAAASRALSFLAVRASGSAVCLALGLAGGRFWAAGVDAGGVRFFLAGMGHLLGLRVESSGGAPVAPPHQGRRVTSTTPPPPGNSRHNPEVFGPRAKALPLRHLSSADLGCPLQFAPAAALLVPIEHCSNSPGVAQRQGARGRARPA